MRPPRWVARLVVVVLVPQFTACKSFQPVEGPFPENRPRYQPDEVSLVFTKDGERIEVLSLWMDSVAVHGSRRAELEDGLWEYRPVRIPIAEVERIEQKQFDLLRTVVVGGAGYVGVGILVYATTYLLLWLAFRDMLGGGVHSPAPQSIPPEPEPRGAAHT